MSAGDFPYWVCNCRHENTKVFYADTVAQGRWQPIETAPRDGTPVDLWNRAGIRQTEVWWDAEDQCWSCCDEDSSFSHWMPLPSPPPTNPPQSEK